MIEIDARGMRCPWPALRLARAMREADAVAIRADDPVAPREFAALAAQHGWRIEPAGEAMHIFRDGIPGVTID